MKRLEEKFYLGNKYNVFMKKSLDFKSDDFF
jgi:hypothetical protein